MSSLLVAKVFNVEKVGPSRKVFGIANLAAKGDGQHFVDAHGDLIPYHVLESAAYGFVKAGNGAGNMHDRMGVGRLIESFVITPDKKQALGDYIRKDAPLAWIVGFEIEDEETIKMLDKGELTEFSIGGMAETRDVGEYV